MDVEELLDYKPVPTPKRSNETEQDSHSSKKARGRQPDIAPAAEPPSKPALNAAEALNILELLDDGDDDQKDVLDENSLSKIILIFEKKLLKNQEMRIKYPDQPDKFMESEIDLFECIQNVQNITTAPDLYPIMIKLNALPSILELLSHQNTDISIAVVNLLQDMTDVDVLHESIDCANMMIEELLKHNTCTLLIQNIERLDESVKEEADGVHNSLAIIENITEIKPEACLQAAEQGLIRWILSKLKSKEHFDANKLYASEILSILLQNDPEIRIMLGTHDGIDVLLQQLAVYKRHDPNSAEEQEFMENLFNCVCSVLSHKENRDRFLKGEGLQLMNLMLREKKLSRYGSLKVLDHAMSGKDGKDNCHKFIDILGLRTIFPLFMKTPKRGKKMILRTDEYDEHVMSIIASMLRNCKGSQRQRLLAKFTENDHEKVDRIMEQHIKYMDRPKCANPADNNELDESDNGYVERLSSGLFTLQLIDYIILEISAAIETAKQRVIKILNSRAIPKYSIKEIMNEYLDNLGDAGGPEWRQHEQNAIKMLIDKF